MGNPKMDEENSNPETGELSDDDFVARMAERRQAAAEAEPEPEPEEAQAEPEAGEGEPEAESEPEEEPAKYTVKIDGVESEVTLDELVKGFQLEADYRRKTQALADERRTIEAEKTRQANITADLIREHQKLLGNDEPEPDWVKLSEEDPIGYVQKRAQWDAKQARKEQARAQSEKLVNQQRMDIAKTEAAKLAEKVTEWRDPETFNRDFTALTAAARDFYGFAPDEVGNVLDHRVLLVLRDAIAGRKLQSAKSVVEKKVAEAPKPVVKPGSPPLRGDNAKDVEAARKRARATGSDEDFLRLLRAKRAR
jgi:hypothetical protein